MVIPIAVAEADPMATTIKLPEDLKRRVRAAAAVIADGIGLLERHPLIGRPVEHELRELLISRGKSGYAALYNFRRAQDVVLVLAIRHQREAGYADLD
jgi:plasmid stabilization system protein ParE